MEKDVATKALEAAELEPADVDLVISATFPALPEPCIGNATPLAWELGMTKAASYNVESAWAVPTDPDELFDFLKKGEYKKFEARESAAHPSLDPHTRVGLPVRVYLDPLLATSLANDETVHPAGAAAVKEMFDADGKLQGWAVEVKTSNDSDGGRGWFWYEVTSTTDGSQPVAAGNGVPLCFGCHSTGTDFVLTRHPLH